MAGAKVWGAPVQNEWKGWVWKNFVITVAGSEWHWPFTAMAGRPDWVLSEEQCVFLQRRFLTAAQPDLCVLPINKQVGQQDRIDQLVSLLSRFCRHLTSASLLRLCLVSASWGPMELFWRSADWSLCTGVGRCSPCTGWAPFIAELAIDMQQLFSPSSSRRVWQTLNPSDGKKDSSKTFGLLQCSLQGAGQSNYQRAQDACYVAWSVFLYYVSIQT